MRKTIIAGVLIALITLVYITAATAANTSSPKAIVQKFLACIAKDDFGGAWKCVAEKSLMKTHSGYGYGFFESMYSNPIFKEIAKGPIKRVENDRSDPSKKTVYVGYTQNGKKKQLGFFTVKEKGIWKVDPIGYKGDMPE